MRKGLIVAVLIGATPAQAGFDRWTTEVEKDPFTGGIRVSITLITSIRSGIYMFCDSTSPGLSIRVVPGYAFEPQFEGMTAIFRIAIDEGVARLRSVGDNLAAIEIDIGSSDAVPVIQAMRDAKSLIQNSAAAFP